MFTSTSCLRRLFAVCLLFLLLPFCACAEEGASPARVYIAVDREEHLPLAGLLAYRAERQGAQVSMYSISLPNDGAFYTSESAVSIQDSFADFHFNRSNPNSNEPSQKFNEFLKSFFDRKEITESPSPGIDIYVLSNFSREKTIFPSNNTTKFINPSYDIIQKTMDNCPQVRLHFYFPSDGSKDTENALDNRLIAYFGDRISSQQIDYTEYSQFVSSISPSSDSLRQRTFEGILPPDGRIAYERKGTSEWLMLSFPPEAGTSDVCFSVAEQPEGSSPLPSFHHGTASNTYWLYLPEGTESRAFTIDCQRFGEAPEADSYTLQTWSTLPAFDVCIYDPQNQRIDPNTSFSTLSEASSWTLELNCPGFTFDDISPRLNLRLSNSDTSDDINSDTDGDAIELQPAEANGNTLRWTFTLPALPPETEGTLCLNCLLWNAPLGSSSFDFTVQNRPPEPISSESSGVKNVYSEIPQEPQSPPYRYTFNLNDYIVEPDYGDSLSFSGPPVRSNNYSFEIKGNTLIYTPNSQAGNNPIDVTATDQHGASASFTFNFTHRSMHIILKALRLEPEDIAQNNVFSIPIREQKPLRFRLRDDKGTLKDTLQTMQDTLHLPPLADCLKVSINNTPCMVQEENGDLIVSYTIPASDVSSSTAMPLKLEARFEYTPSDGSDSFPFPIRLELTDILHTQFSYVYSNEAPSLKPGLAQTQEIGSCDIDGLPGKYKPVLFSKLFHDGKPLQLDQLFENKEANDPLTYTIKVNSGCLAVRSSNFESILNTDNDSHSFTAEVAAQPFELSLNEPGQYSFEIYATDSGGENSPHITYSVKLNSSFIRGAIIVVIAAIILTALTAVVLIILYKRKPSFKGLSVCIRHLRGQQNFSQNDDSMDTLIPLDSYNKNAVSLMALLAASGHLPPQTCSPEVLMHISLVPGKHVAVFVTCGADVKSPSVSMSIDGKPPESPRRFTMACNQTLRICFWQDGQSDTLLLRVKKN